MIFQFNGDYHWLSNFYSCIVELDGKLYPSVEHAYQSAKSDSENWKLECQLNPSPGTIKRKGKEVEVVEDWETKKIYVMAKLINQKFSKEPFKTLLLATGEEVIQEGNYWTDSFWGVDLKTGKGLNILGKMIMNKRNLLRSKE